MNPNSLKTSVRTLMMVILLIAINLLYGCSSQSKAPIHDRASIYKGKTYQVTRGDTLFSIAWKNNIDYKRLSEINGIKPPYIIYPGQIIKLRGGSSANKRDFSAIDNPNSTCCSKKGSSAGRLEARRDKTPMAIRWQWPSIGKSIAPFQGNSVSNKGIDINGNLGEPVLAAAAGRVVYAGSGLSGYGNLLIIKHNDIFLSAYAHNERLLAKEGDFVKDGQRIADMGSSGTDRVKLHFEIRSEGSPVDPLKYLPKRQ